MGNKSRRHDGNCEPDWSETPPEPGSFRSIFKYGAPDQFKHPNSSWVNMLRDELALPWNHFQGKQAEGRQKVVLARPSGLTSEQVERLQAIVGPENSARDDYQRVRYSYGKSTEEMMTLSQAAIGPVADLVLHPRHKEDVKAIIAYCHLQRIAVVAFAGGTSVTLGLRPVNGGVVLVLSTHMNQLLEINETDQTARVQPGMFGSDYERALNQAPEIFQSKRRFTGGHFPQSFEYSTVGGWIVTFGSGQASTYYGDAVDLVISQEYVTPAGSFRTRSFPAAAIGPRINAIMAGSEGAFGVLVELTLKIYRQMPSNRQCFSFIFPTWSAAVDASREIAQGQFGRPAVYRISDPDETDRGLKLYGLPRLVDRYLQWRGHLPMQRCLCLGNTDGDAGYTRLVHRRICQIAKRQGAINLRSQIYLRWERTRFSEPLMREDLNDFGILIDTLETSVNWKDLHRLHKAVRSYITARPRTICMAHASHFYPQGTNLYFIIIARFGDVDAYRQFQSGIIDQIETHGGSLSHHHGIGRLMAPWLETHLGSVQMEILRVLKRHFDPHHILNPGGLLGLDLTKDQRRSDQVRSNA